MYVTYVRYLDMTQYRIHLTKEERDEINRELNSQVASRVRKLEALLQLDHGEFAENKPKTIAEVSKNGLSEKTLRNLVKTVCEHGIDKALDRKEYDGKCRPIKFDGEFEAKITMLACTDPPEGASAWTLRLLADKAVEAGFVDTVSPMTIQRILKKKKLSLTRPSTGKSPMQAPST